MIPALSLSYAATQIGGNLSFLASRLREPINSASYPAKKDFAAADCAEWLELRDLERGTDSIASMLVPPGDANHLVKTLSKLAATNITVLVEGESGTGKELASRAIHSLGNRTAGPFVVFNCSNLVDSLAESQLFGHVRGAFTDARENSLGYFRAASGGTLFLDEIGELPLNMQPKLLRVVETLEVQPVGSSQSQRVDVRIVAATNRDLRAMVSEGTFRADLYYRLSAATLRLPTLRERRESIPSLVAHFIRERGPLVGRQITHVSRRALDGVLMRYDWPGNIRQLAHAIESAMITSETNRIDVDDLPQFLTEESRASESELDSAVESSDFHSSVSDHQTKAPVTMREIMRQAIMRSLARTKGNRKRAAEELGISRPRLYRLLEDLGVAACKDALRSRKPRFDSVDTAITAAGR
jgi:DNA-binding NtrC family response regulator